MGRNIWHFMETECPKSIKKPFRISRIAAVALSEQLCMPVMTVKPYTPSLVAVEIGIVQHVSRIKRINGYTNKWENCCLPIISS